MEQIAVIGLGYVGLPLALALSKRFPVVGFDTSKDAAIRAFGAGLSEVGDDPILLRKATFYIVAVPTPVDANCKPDLSALRAATETVGRVLKAGDVVVYESTVAPGTTENLCRDILERVSRLPHDSFRLGFSPERINPGDHLHTVDKVTKIIAAEDLHTLDRLHVVYGAITRVHRAQSIRVAEAAKLLENVQRDVNIALMNEAAELLNDAGIKVSDVLEAMRTKWNALDFRPGLVGGHCIAVDPYYWIAWAESFYYSPTLVADARNTNECTGDYLGRQTAKLLMGMGIDLETARVAVLGLTYKANVSDLRNSKVFAIVAELRAYGIDPIVIDPLADPAVAQRYGVTLQGAGALVDLDAVVLAVPHEEFFARGGSFDRCIDALNSPSVLVDVGSWIHDGELPANCKHWTF